MFLNKFFYFLKGYVIIEVTGKSVWKLVSECANRDIRLYNITSHHNARFSVLLKDFYEVYMVAVQMDVNVTILKANYPERLMRLYSKRIGFALGGIIFVLFFMISSLFLWDIRYETDGSISKTQVEEVLAQIGVKPGAMLKELPDGVAIKNHLVNSIDNVPWAWVYIKGVRATVVLHEGKVPPVVVDEDVPCDVIASRDGFIVDMSVKKGMKVIEKGNAVNAGETIISGLVEVGKDENKSYYTTHAEGEVYALTRYEKTATYKLHEEIPDFTGRKKTSYRIFVFGREFNLFAKHKYKEYVTVENKLLDSKYFKLEQIKNMEAEISTVQLPEDTVVEFAKRDLGAQIGYELGKKARLQSEDYIIDKGVNSVTVTAVMEFIEDIAVSVPR